MALYGLINAAQVVYQHELASNGSNGTPAGTTGTTSSTSDVGGKANAGPIAGGVVGGAVIVAIVAILLLWWKSPPYWHAKQRRRAACEPEPFLSHLSGQEEMARSGELLGKGSTSPKPVSGQCELAPGESASPQHNHGGSTCFSRAQLTTPQLMSMLAERIVVEGDAAYENVGSAPPPAYVDAGPRERRTENQETGRPRKERT